jgi:hypothetical protein
MTRKLCHIDAFRSPRINGQPNPGIMTARYGVTSIAVRARYLDVRLVTRTFSET